MSDMANRNQAREAILAELKRRHDAGDRRVQSLDHRDEHRWHKPQANYYSGSGTMLCPCCGGHLAYVRSDYNGHVSARCTGEGCVNWIE